MSQTFGDFVQLSQDKGEFLKIGFHPSSMPLQQRWRNNGLSADFLAGYMGTFFPGDDSSSAGRQSEIQDAVSYIANELLENAMKYSQTSTHHTVSIEISLDSDVIILNTTNCMSAENVETFQAFIRRLLSEDTLELYMEQLERNAEEDGSGSGLGFLTMINDYGATLAWQFSDGEPGRDEVFVATMVRLVV